MIGYEALQRAIYETLIGYSDLTVLLNEWESLPTVFEQAPQANDGADPNAFPYITFENITTDPWDTDTETGAEVIFKIDVWSRTNNNDETNAIMTEVYNALHRKDFVIPGFTLIGCDLESSFVSLDPDGITRHGVQRYLIRYED